MVTQLLALSRVEAVAALPRRHVSLDALVRSESEDVLAVAAQRDQVVELDLQPTLVIADETALSLLLRNLLENAVRYTPPGGRIRISTDPDPSPTMVVEDSGPGIAEEARARVFHRFHRELGTGVEGSRLGLSIPDASGACKAAALRGGRCECAASARSTDNDARVQIERARGSTNQRVKGGVRTRTTRA